MAICPGVGLGLAIGAPASYFTAKFVSRYRAFINANLTYGRSGPDKQEGVVF